MENEIRRDIQQGFHLDATKNEDESFLDKTLEKERDFDSKVIWNFLDRFQGDFNDDDTLPPNV